MSLARRYAPCLVGLALLGISLTLGLLAVRGVAWPPLYDALRDVGTAQVLLDGRYPADNMYPREVWWFNPLMGALVALASLLTGWPPPMASVQLGPWLNLLPALLFWLLSSRWLGRWGGIAALGGYLLWNAHSPSVVFATYTRGCSHRISPRASSARACLRGAGRVTKPSLGRMCWWARCTV